MYHFPYNHSEKLEHIQAELLGVLSLSHRAQEDEEVW